jgi:hypothetical protein
MFRLPKRLESWESSSSLFDRANADLAVPPPAGVSALPDMGYWHPRRLPTASPEIWNSVLWRYPRKHEFAGLRALALLVPCPAPQSPPSSRKTLARLMPK